MKTFRKFGKLNYGVEPGDGLSMRERWKDIES